MTTDIEKQFFETFGIEPKYRDYRVKNGKEYESKNPNNRNIRLCYLQITDRILLELICLLNKYSFLDLWGEDIKELKSEVLDNCITIALDGSLDEATQQLKRYKQQVQSLFKEG